MNKNAECRIINNEYKSGERTVIRLKAENNKWLTTFHYQVLLEFSLFLIAALLVLVVSLIAISFQSIKVAMANPVKVLRSE
ncbi:hypothetical protein A8C56_11140 [Niabella ginsenosidivorans]|uniref:Uncharacterized protein n=1 Tax=Niabella ginsenosidivorans TaxID=1176587 RepID=A0A1A9I458_9BACT|nr:hypothetical protein A8C56_11140 [Niabella ginsenosidivorans]